MRKFWCLLLIIFSLFSCTIDNGSNNIMIKYNISFDNCGIGTTIERIENVAKVPTNLPTLFEDGYKFIGWYLDQEYTEIVKEEELLNSNLTLYAKWEKLEYTDGLEFTLSSDGEYYILNHYEKNTGKDIVIPPTYIGLPVKVIGEGSFMRNDEIESVMIPSSVEVIDAYAFSSCSNLKYLSVGKKVKTIDKYSLCNTRSLETIIVDLNNSTFDSRNNCNAIIEIETNTLIKGCKNTIIPEGVKSIYKYAFYGSDLIEISIPNSVSSIGECAFHSCSKLNTIVIGSGLANIDLFAFVNCESLKYIYNNSILNFIIGDNQNGNIAYYALKIYNKGEWSYVNGEAIPNN